MKQSILGLAMAVCMLIAMTGCGSTVLTVPTPSEGAAQENETFSTQPDSAPNATPQESLPPTETGEAAPPHEPDETARPGTTANPSELAQSGTTAAPHTTPPVSTVTPPSKTPESSQLVTDALIQNGGASQNSTTGQKTQAPVISQITQLESGFSSASFSGNDGFEDFLELGGASTDAQVTAFLSTRLASNAALAGGAFGCSTIAVKSPAGNSLFGRNFDWQACDALVVTSKPEGGYASISTVNMDFIRQGDDGSLGTALQQTDARVMAALYAPLDGMNEKGLAVSVNMIQDSASINQSTDKPDITTTTAIRLLLNKAASVAEALELVGMSGFARRSFSTLSGGEQQRVILARALAQQTPCLILDEPTNHLDIKYQLELMDIVKSLDRTVISAIHDLNIAAMYCDRLYAVKGGEIVGCGRPQEVLTEDFIRRVYEVEAKVFSDESGQLHILYHPAHRL